MLDAYLDGTMLDALQQRAGQVLSELKDLRPEEAAVMGLLMRRLAREQAKA